jgi:hypothetical protein
VFNPHPKIDAVTIAGRHVCLVIDDALLEPERMVDYAVAHRDAFAMAPFNAYPGLEFHLPAALSRSLDDFFRQHIRRLIGARRTLQMYSRLSLVTLQPDQLTPIQWLCHRDRMGVPREQCVAASVLYLFKDESLGGTSFFMPKNSVEETEALMRRAAASAPDVFAAEAGVVPGYLVESNAHFERVCTVPPRWNRMIFYDGSFFHSPDIRAPQKLSADMEQGRLTMNGFFTCSRIAT